MLELLIGFFILGSLSLAFREEREQQLADELSELGDPDYHFDESVYSPEPVAEPEFTAKHIEYKIPRRQEVEAPNNADFDALLEPVFEALPDNIPDAAMIAKFPDFEQSFES